MNSGAKSLAQKEKSIESKRSLLAYLRSNPQRLTMESYLCLTRILTESGWQFTDGQWSKLGNTLPTIEAAIVELQQQVACQRDRLLSQTVTHYAAETKRSSEAS
jgi:hypothetical protein